MLALAPSLTWVFIARALDGVTAANIVTARAYISDVTPPRQRTHAFGLVSSAFGFGFLVGPGVTGILARHSLQMPLWLAAAMSAASIVATATLLPGHWFRGQHADAGRTAPVRAGVFGNARGFLTDRTLAPRMGQMFAFVLAFSIFTSGFALFSERRFTWHGAAFGTVEVGWALAYAGFLSLVTQVALLRQLVARCGEIRLVLGSGLLAIVTYGVLGRAQGLLLLAACLTFLAFANSVLRPCLLGLISMGAAPTQQGAVLGFTQVLQSSAMLLGPLVAGELIQLGWLDSWGAACAAPLVAMLLLASVRRRSPTAG